MYFSYVRIYDHKEFDFFNLSREESIFKNVSNLFTFLWQTQIQTIKYDHNDMKQFKKKQAKLILSLLIYTLRC